MNMIFSADWHITTRKPRIRTDDYTATQLHKCAWICEQAVAKNAALVIAGDIFDKPVCTFQLLSSYIRMFKTVRQGVYVVYGQHDLHFHNPDLSRTPLGIMLEAGAVQWADSLGFTCVNFGEEVPREPESPFLCIHAPITKDAPPFFMEDALSAKQFMNHYKEYDLVVSGDWHESFAYITKDDRLLVNPGPITRPSKDKQNFKPRLFLYREDGTNEWLDIPIDDDVFDLDLMDKDDLSEHREQIREFAANISENMAKQNFKDNLQLVVEETQPNKGVIAVLDNVMSTINT